MPEVMGPEFRGRADYFNTCRATRHVTDYDRAGVVSAAEAEEILKEASAFKAEVIDWLKANHPHLLR